MKVAEIKPVAVVLNEVIWYPSLKGEGGTTPSEAVGRELWLRVLGHLK